MDSGMDSGTGRPGYGRWLILGAIAVAFVAVPLALSGSSEPEPSGRPSPVRSPRGEPEPQATPPSQSPGSTTVVEPAGPPLEADGVYRWLWADPADIRFVWRDEADQPYAQLEAARKALEADGQPVVAITNGGIHRPDLVPSGLYIEDGEEQVGLNQGSGSGNFFLKPNGVFWLGEGRGQVETTEEFAAAPAGGRSIEQAIQSGPLLVIDSEINQAFSPDSTSTYRRNAVAVDDGGRVLLIMADRPVTLWAMAERCRQLGATDALYLDGTISRFEYVAGGRSIFPNIPLAAMIAVVDRGDRD